MSTRQALRTVVAEEAAAEDFASGTEFGPEAFAITDDDFTPGSDPNDPKTLIKRMRSRFETVSASLDTQKKAAEARIASATEDLRQINECIEVITPALDRLAKEESK